MQFISEQSMAKHKNKKAAILSVATTVIGSGSIAMSEGRLYAGLILILLGGLLFAAYEIYQVEQLPAGVDAETLQKFAEQAGDQIEHRVEDDSGDDSAEKSGSNG